MTAFRSLCPRPCVPFTIVADGEEVHLIGGEDVRYTVQAGSRAGPLAVLLGRCDGRTPLAALLSELPEADRGLAQQLFDRLLGERVFLEGPAEATHVAGCYRPVVEGRGPLVERLATPSADTPALAILCQDALDPLAALEFNRRCLGRGGPWLWVTTGPASRGFVSPVFLPVAGPCLACLLGHFRRLSPVPHLQDALVRHAEQGGAFTPAPFPPEGVTILEQLVRWKVEQLSRPIPSAAVFRLHVLELETMEVSVHRVFFDPTCPECADARLA